MQAYTARCVSFTPTSRSKSSSLRWPHPETYLATPTSLAAAGFYFNPSGVTPDAVSCFMCDKGLADWDPDDDPANIHAQKCPKCPWAMLRCITDTVEDGSMKFASPSRLPASRPMEKARLATFGPESKRWWPHESKNKGPSSKTMAKAGFIYTPTSLKDDTCICIYCGTELGGWQPDDDPMEEHRRRQSKNGPCPFFARETSTSTTKQRARSKSKPPTATPVASDLDDNAEDEYRPTGRKSSARTPAASTNSKKSNNGAKSSKTKSSKKPAKTKTIEEEVVEEYHVALDEDAPPKPRPKPRRASSRASSFQSSEDEEFAREEQALDEQARELMLADETLTLAATPLDKINAGLLKTATRHDVFESKKKGKGKATLQPLEDTMDTDRPVPPPTTPPPATPATPPPAIPRAVNQSSVPTAVKFPQLVPEDTLTSLTDVERAMTVEQWVRYEMDRQYERLRKDGRQKIDAFKARAAEVAKQLENM